MKESPRRAEAFHLRLVGLKRWAETPKMSKGRDSHTLATVLFTDIVGSSRFASELGDRRWRVLLDRHHAIVRKAIKRHRGKEIDTAGDGFFARFSDQVDAIRCACQISDDVTALGIEVRAGCHVGQAEVMGKKLGGVTVHVGARVMAEAGPSEVLVSSMLKDLVPASGFSFSDRGIHQLKNIDGDWHLYAVTGVDGAPRPVRPDPEEAARLREEIKPPPLTERRSGRIGIAALALILAAGAAIFVANRPNPIKVLPNSLVQIDPNTNGIVSDVAVQDPDGAQITFVPPTHEIWVLSQQDQVISVVDTRTHEVHPVPVAGGVAEPAQNGYGIVYAFGRVWVTGGHDVLERFDPKDHTVWHHPIRFPEDCPSVLARGLDRVWVAMTCTDQVDALNRKGHIVMESDPEAAGIGIAVGSGSVWTSNYVKGSVAEVNPATGKVDHIPLSSQITIGSQSGITAYGVLSRITIAFGSVWVSDNVNGLVYRIHPDDDPVVNTIPIGGNSAFLGSGIAEGAGSIWVTSPGTDAVVRIDPNDNTVQASIPLPYPPNGLVYADGSIWATVNPDSQ
jgi:class 3 adenylate cyclase/streptogramin lyase